MRGEWNHRKSLGRKSKREYSVEAEVSVVVFIESKPPPPRKKTIKAGMFIFLTALLVFLFSVYQ
jgi:hypothetical protein